MLAPAVGNVLAHAAESQTSTYLHAGTPIGADKKLACSRVCTVPHSGQAFEHSYIHAYADTVIGADKELSFLRNDSNRVPFALPLIQVKVCDNEAFQWSSATIPSGSAAGALPRRFDKVFDIDLKRSVFTLTGAFP